MKLSPIARCATQRLALARRRELDFAVLQHLGPTERVEEDGSRHCVFGTSAAARIAAPFRNIAFDERASSDRRRRPSRGTGRPIAAAAELRGRRSPCSPTSRIRRISGRRCRRNIWPASCTRERLLLRPAAFYAEKGVTLEQNARVEELDAAARRVRLRDGRTLALRPVAARDGQPRAQPRRAGRDAARRALPAHDRRRRRHHLVARRRERGCCWSARGTSAWKSRPSSRQRGFDVTVLEAADRVMARAVSVEVSAFYEAAHRAAAS